jgi:hypothetical protein
MQGSLFGSPVDKHAILDGRKAGHCTNERMGMEFCRTAWISEMGENDKPDDTFLKQIRGRTDKVFLKGMYEYGRMVQLQAKLLVLSNFDLNIKSNDGALQSAHIPIPLRARFLNPDKFEDWANGPEVAELRRVHTWPNAEFVFARNEKDAEEVIQCTDELFYWLLAGTIRLYSSEFGGILRFHPTWIIEKKELSQEQDTVQMFIAGELETTQDTEGHLPEERRSFEYQDKVFAEYGTWYTRTFPASRNFMKADKRAFEMSMRRVPFVKEGKKRNKKVWIGIRTASLAPSSSSSSSVSFGMPSSSFPPAGQTENPDFRPYHPGRVTVID